MLYAMILLKRVIDIVTSDTIPSYPPDQHGNPVTAVQCDESVTVGMIYNAETGEFTEPPKPTPKPKVPTQLDRIEESQLTIMEAMADQYEQSLANRLDDQEVQATIFETILELGGNV